MNEILSLPFYRLKDSDVTWLYGPLHTAADPVPPPKLSSTEDRFNLVKASGKKPILKHRTISDMLNIPLPEPPSSSTTVFSSSGQASPILESVAMELGQSPDLSSESLSTPERPPMYHTRSDTDILRRTSRRTSPPRVTELLGGATETSDTNGSNSASYFLSRERSYSNSPRSGTPLSDGLGSGSGGSGTALAPPAKKHISFNTFVAQCRSIDQPIKVSKRTRADGSDSDEEYDEDDDVSSSSSSSVIEMNPPVISSGAGIASVQRPPIGRKNSSSLTRANSHHSEHVTIVPIAPTFLKESDNFPAPSPAVVFAPPEGSNFTYLPSPGNESPESDTSTSSELSDDGTSGIDFSFVPPQWGRPAATVVAPQDPAETAANLSPPFVGTGALGPVGPSGDFNAVPFHPPKYQAQHPIARQQYPGMKAGRSKWVDESQIVEVDEDEEDDSGEGDSEDYIDYEEDEAVSGGGSRRRRRRRVAVSPESSTVADDDYFGEPDLSAGDDYSAGGGKGDPGGGRHGAHDSESSNASTTSSSTILPSPTSPRSPSARSTSNPPPGRSILKNAPHPSTDPSTSKRSSPRKSFCHIQSP